ncbi:DUF4178 domain-containing protein [Patulibacter sp.]|uniref:DUF4178 domain-containing protein n=1 Tax=Patulibacter sp. TaxID=1912859 RepID=UPI00272469D9|nr:DUF4178 domain-containing protein [Patulibacter sp.]MDO9409431.1 DUF4178 domain-containing protein [Patulibacter sp.]
MGFAIAIVVLVLIGVAVVVVLRNRSAAEGSALPAPKDPLADATGSPLDALGVGAVVSHGGHDYVVRGQIRFDEDGYVWSEYHLDAGQDVRTWLSVDLSDGTDVALWNAVEAPGGLSPDGGAVTFEGRTYKKVESGSATFTSTGTTGLPDSGRARYADYKAEGGRLLSFEQWSGDGSWEVSTGSAVGTHLLEIYPAGTAAGGVA